MTVSFIGAASAEATSLTLPTHQAGDLIIFGAFRNGSVTLPTLPSGWLILNAQGAATAGLQRSMYFAYKYAASSSETSDTWTDANLVAAIVFRDDTNIIIPHVTQAATLNNATTANYTAAAHNTSTGTASATNRLQQSSQWVVGFAACLSNTSAINTAPTGMTNRTATAGASASEIAIHDTNGTVSSFNASTSLGETTSIISLTIGIADTGIAKSSGGGFRHVNIRGGADQ